jgi:HTH-type transcriptional regulator/antitoxin HigA
VKKIRTHLGFMAEELTAKLVPDLNSLDKSSLIQIGNPECEIMDVYFQALEMGRQSNLVVKTTQGILEAILLTFRPEEWMVDVFGAGGTVNRQIKPGSMHEVKGTLSIRGFLNTKSYQAIGELKSFDDSRMLPQLSEAIKYWAHIAPVVKYPKNNKEFNELVSQLDELLEIVSDDEEHRLMSLVHTLSGLISSYEEQHFQAPAIKGIDALKFLMKAHHLSQSDLPEIGSQGVLSEILNGKRKLNLRQTKLLSKRFRVDSSTFIDD